MVASDTQGTPLDAERYINLETFRKDGTGVKTPVWAAALDGRLVVFTDGTSYKVKRLRANPAIKAAACDVRGNVRGAWHDGTARIRHWTHRPARVRDGCQAGRGDTDAGDRRHVGSSAGQGRTDRGGQRTGWGRPDNGVLDSRDPALGGDDRARAVHTLVDHDVR